MGASGSAEPALEITAESGPELPHLRIFRSIGLSLAIALPTSRGGGPPFERFLGEAPASPLGVNREHLYLPAFALATSSPAPTALLLLRF